jgi:ATP-binding cassette subfamily C (CFTR/MRP) protein 1
MQVDGLTTLRSFQWLPAAVQHNSRSVSQSQRPEFLLLALQRWLNVVLDLFSAGIAVSVIALAVALHGSVSGGQIGMALNVVLVANTTLLRLVESWTGLEVALGAVARVRALEKEVAPEEVLGETFSPLDNWPTSGEIEITSVTAAYQ